jgi:hypothetical protein
VREVNGRERMLAEEGGGRWPRSEEGRGTATVDSESAERASACGVARGSHHEPCQQQRDGDARQADSERLSPREATSEKSKTWQL